VRVAVKAQAEAAVLACYSGTIPDLEIEELVNNRGSDPNLQALQPALCFNNSTMHLSRI